MAKEQCNFPSSLDVLSVERVAPAVVAGDTMDIIETAITQMQAEMRRVTVKTGTGTLTASEGGLIKVSAAAPYTLYLPTAVGNTGLRFFFIKTDDNSNVITIDGDGTETINGELTSVILDSQWKYFGVESDGTNYIIIWKYGEGTTTFVGLTDTPSVYTDKAGELLRVNATPDAVEFSGVAIETTLSPASDVKIPTSKAVATHKKLAQLFPSIYNRDIKWQLKEPYSTAAYRYTIQTPNKLSVDVNGTVYFIETQSDINLSVEASWDTVAVDYRVAATRAGKDFYIYACVPASGDAPTIKLSVNSTVPTGYTSSNSRKIGGFHCLCVAVGTITGHTLTTFVAGDVLPASIWDLRHRAVSENEGMVYDEKSQVWVDIYLTSGTGASTVSANGGTISDTRNWMDFVDDGGAVGKRMLSDIEFQLMAAGSNEETNIAGSADPGTTGGHSDTAGRRMISNIGCEDCCGVLWQWLNEQSYKEPATPSWNWYNLPGSKGSIYNYGGVTGDADVKLRAGADWNSAANSGSRARNAIYSRWGTHSSLGCRFGAEPRKSE